MASGGGVVEISSDEENYPAGNKLPVDSLVWASDLFDALGQDGAVKDDLDDLMVMSEWSSPPVLQKTTKPDDLVIMNELSSPAVHQKDKSGGGRDEESDDDDCVVLDGDPDKAFTAGEEEGSVGDSSSDELQIVAEKGPVFDPFHLFPFLSIELHLLYATGLKKPVEKNSAGAESDFWPIYRSSRPNSVKISRFTNSDPAESAEYRRYSLACRDFPHSRHLCSNFPFNTTSHAKYCNMCHCFVCDAPAPCKYWGNGASVTEHCHATDKEGQWKELRQAFKCKTMPASGPGKHQSVTCSTMLTPLQQSILFGVAVPQSLPSNMAHHHSVANQSPVLYDVSQIQQRNSSVRVSLCLAGTVSTPTAGRGEGNSHIPQNTHSRAMFKRLGSFPPVRTTTNSNRFGSAATPDNSLMNQDLPNVSRPVQVAPRTNAFSGIAHDSAPQRSFSAPLAFQAQQGQPAAYGQVAPNGKNVTGSQLSRCTSLTAQITQCLDEPVIDVTTKSWEDILACVASDLGVPDYNISSTEPQHVTANSGPVHSTASQGLDLQCEPVAGTDNLASSLVSDLLNHTTGGNTQADGPLQTTESMSMHHLNCQSSLVPNETLINNFASGPVDDLAIETARQLEISGLESNILFEFDWDCHGSLP